MQNMLYILFQSIRRGVFVCVDVHLIYMKFHTEYGKMKKS